MKLLHIDSSITGDQSVSRRLTSRIVERLRETSPSLAITYRDLVKQPLPHHAVSHSSERDLAETQAVLDEFLAADIVVIGAPMYNFTIPSQLKAWIDALVIAGKTFTYTENGPQGLAAPKRVIVASSRGGVYTTGPAAAFDHQESYLLGILGFIGINNVEFVPAEGVALGTDARRGAIESANAHAGRLSVQGGLAAA
jgi:FMN-dependent NADH-azoreductase